MTAKRGDWVRIHAVLMDAGYRAPGVPVDTAGVPYELWDKGFLIQTQAEIEDAVDVETITGRKVSGTLIEINPSYKHGFGEFVPEILTIDRQLKALKKELEQ